VAHGSRKRKKQEEKATVLRAHAEAFSDILIESLWSEINMALRVFKQVMISAFTVQGRSYNPEGDAHTEVACIWTSVCICRLEEVIEVKSNQSRLPG